MTDEPDKPEKKPRVKLLDGAAGEAAEKLLTEANVHSNARGLKDSEDGYWSNGRFIRYASRNTEFDAEDDEYLREARARRAQYRPAQPEPTPRYETNSVGQSSFAGIHYFSTVLPQAVRVNTSVSYAGKEVFSQVSITTHATEEALLDLAKTLQAVETQVRDALTQLRLRKKEAEDKAKADNPEPKDSTK